jgi:hypothetical protein
VSINNIVWTKNLKIVEILKVVTVSIHAAWNIIANAILAIVAVISFATVWIAKIEVLQRHKTLKG